MLAMPLGDNRFSQMILRLPLPAIDHPSVALPFLAGVSAPPAA